MSCDSSTRCESFAFDAKLKGAGPELRDTLRQRLDSIRMDEDGDDSGSDAEPLEYAMLDAMAKLPGGEASKLLNKVQKLQQKQTDTEMELEREVSERRSRDEADLQAFLSEQPDKPSRGLLAKVTAGLVLAGLGLAFAAAPLLVPNRVAQSSTELVAELGAAPFAVNEKLDALFHRFDKNRDALLSKTEFIAFGKATNPQTRIPDSDIIEAADKLLQLRLDEGVTKDQLRSTYDKGFGDIDEDYTTVFEELAEVLEAQLTDAQGKLDDLKVLPKRLSEAESLAAEREAQLTAREAEMAQAQERVKALEAELSQVKVERVQRRDDQQAEGRASQRGRGKRSGKQGRWVQDEI